MANYRVHRKDKKGEPWFLSVSSRHFPKVNVKRGQQSTVKIKPIIHLKLKSRIVEDSLRIHVGVADTHHGGVTIYHQGKRIPLPYRVLDAQGKSLASGVLKYG